jgi:hypothetical protein
VSISADAEWGEERHQTLRSADELDALLDRIEADARASGRPQNVEIVLEGEAGRLAVVVGHERSFLSHIPWHLDPPYAISVGDEDEDRAFTFYVAGDHHSEVHWRHTIPAEAAREAVRVFLLHGALDERVRWEV